jgi:hypothetical protein
MRKNMSLKQILTLTILIFLILSCNDNGVKNHTNSLIILNSDFNRYEMIFEKEVMSLYAQIYEADKTDTIEELLFERAREIKEHTDNLLMRLDDFKSKIKKDKNLEIPSFRNFKKQDWNRLNTTGFNSSNKVDEQEAFKIKEDLTSYKMHLLHINQKDIKSEKLKNFLTNSIFISDYFVDETWGNTLIVDKSNLDLITVINKIIYEIRISEYIIVNNILMKLDK